MNSLIILAMSDVFWQAAIAAVVTIVLAIMAERAKKAAVEAANKAASKAETAAVKVEEVATKLNDTTTHTDGKLDEILQFVNSPYGVALTLNAGNARFKANTEKTKENEDAANLAERLLEEHRANQAKVDENRMTPEKLAAAKALEENRTHL